MVIGDVSDAIDPAATVVDNTNCVEANGTEGLDVLILCAEKSSNCDNDISQLKSSV